MSEWDYPGGPIALSALQRQRQEFWESRVSGAKLVWDNLKVVCDALLNTPPEYESALAILEAAQLRVPHGTLETVYDSRGRMYSVPPFVWSTPRNVMSDEEAARIAAAKRKKFVGKVKPLPLFARLSTTDTTQEQTIKIAITNKSTGAELKQAIHEFLASGEADKGKADGSINTWAPAGLPPAMQRLFYMGREIHDEDHMQGAQVDNDCVVQVFIAQGARAISTGGAAAAAASGGGGS